jgi:hypothetical protein
MNTINSKIACSTKDLAIQVAGANFRAMHKCLKIILNGSFRKTITPWE